MKAGLVGFQCAELLLAMVILWLYPITRPRAEETQRKLREAAIRSILCKAQPNFPTVPNGLATGAVQPKASRLVLT
jgi:hypothetical protein